MQMIQTELPTIEQIAPRQRRCLRSDCPNIPKPNGKYCSNACRQWCWRNKAKPTDDGLLVTQPRNVTLRPNELKDLVNQLTEALRIQLLEQLASIGGGNGGPAPQLQELNKRPSPNPAGPVSDLNNIELEVKVASGDGASNHNFAISMVGIGVSKIPNLPNEVLEYAIKTKKLPIAECQAVLNDRAAKGKYSPPKTGESVTDRRVKSLSAASGDGSIKEIVGAARDFATPDFEELDLL